MYYLGEGEKKSPPTRASRGEDLTIENVLATQLLSYPLGTGFAETNHNFLVANCKSLLSVVNCRTIHLTGS